MGDKADDILSSLQLAEDKQNDYDEVKDAFDGHFVGVHNVIFERAKFNKRSQEVGESAENFITAVHMLAEHCKYGVLREELIRDRIVVGIRDAKLSEKMQLNPKLDLSTAIVQVRQHEEVKKQQVVLRSADSPGQIDAVSYNSKRQAYRKNSAQRVSLSLPQPTQSNVGSVAKPLHMHGLNAQQKMLNVENVKRGDTLHLCADQLKT